MKSAHRKPLSLRPKYSGPASVPFWRRVKRLGERNDAAYALGCALQELEHRTLREIENTAQSLKLDKETP